jgi:hypothetical protein
MHMHASIDRYIDTVRRFEKTEQKDRGKRWRGGITITASTGEAPSASASTGGAMAVEILRLLLPLSLLPPTRVKVRRGNPATMTLAPCPRIPRNLPPMEGFIPLLLLLLPLLCALTSVATSTF